METERPKTGVFLERYAVNPVNGERLPIYAADYVLADYGHGAIMAVPAHDQRDLDFALAFHLPVRVVVDTGGPDPQTSGIATPGDGTLVNSGSLDGLDKERAIARIVEELEAKGLGRAATNYRLRDWLISRQRYWGTPIPIIHCPVDGEVAVPDDQLPVELPPSAGLDLTPEGHLAAGRGDRLGRRHLPGLRRPGPPRHGHDGHVRRLVLVLPALPVPAAGDRAVRPGRGAALDARRPVRRRCHPRDPAPAVQPVLHQGAARPGHGRVRRAVHAAAEPGHGADGRRRDEQVARQPGPAVRRAGRPRRRRGAADDGVRRPARGRHRLGRRVPERLGEVPEPLLAAVRRGDQPGVRRPVDRRRSSCARSTHQHVDAAATRCREVPVQRGGRADDGAGQRHPAGDRHRAADRPTPRSARPSRRSR